MGARNRKNSGHQSGHTHSKPKGKRLDKSHSTNDVLANKSMPPIVKSINNKTNEKRDNSVHHLLGPWSPSPSTAFKALLSARLSAAVWNNISDCDETFNYWEPTHYLIHGLGFQTWEYSPLYAIRSYAFLWIYALPAFIYTHLIQTNQLLVFYYTRCILAFCCALCETYLYRGILRQFGPSIARLFLLFMVLSNGMFISSTAFLPSSFSMYMTALTFGAWLQQHHKIVILTQAISSLIGWPFTALLGLPIAIEMLINKKKRFFFAKWSAIIGLSILVICKLLVKSKRNIVNSSHIICVTSLLLWYLVFFSQPHKEERFIFPVYPLICLSAAFAIEMVQKALVAIIPRLTYFYSSLVLVFVIIFAFLSISRGLALYKGYHAPLDIYMDLGRVHNDYNISSLKTPVNVCVGKEWYRYPSSFFLPSVQHWKLQFIQSEFRGQLPQPYNGGTRVIPSNMNDLNREELSRYIQVADCHFLIDTDATESTDLEPQFSRDYDHWEVLQSLPFLDAKNSPTLFRAFYVPFVTESKCNFVDYNLLRNKRFNLTNNDT
ncbi:alpha-1,2-mannosyltransferase ALG9-like isoform X2 [Oppia nitens]|uniref:alpha-1,2-mannosyltransferase ALG9-like isoform X2 n=1 Tax=Oppia nitens TaxID=1686743 RepID=UPI0023DAFF98|nr:alpha-1,2-mannosyltransferase ALG9-like isoform X2 [Oppia nitens]